MITSPSLLFTSSKHPMSKVIRFFTNPIKTLRGEFVPSHVATFLRVNTGVEGRTGEWVVEATYGHGVTIMPYQTWYGLQKGKVIKVSMLRASVGDRIKYSGEMMVRAVAHEGKNYENIMTMWRIPFNKNREGASRLFCSELTKYIWGNVLDITDKPDDTSPEDIYRFVSQSCHFNPGSIRNDH